MLFKRRASALFILSALLVGPAYASIENVLGPSPLQPIPPASKQAVDRSKSVKNLTLFNCSDLRRAAMKLSVHSSNLANRNTTRTPEGGPYKRMEVSCKVSGAFCDVQKTDDFKSVYDPNHADAGEGGYVKFPAINAGTEWAGVNSAATEIKILASQGVCGTKTLEQGTAMIIKYHEDFDVQADTISFKPDGRVASWSRTTKDGKSQSLTFRDDGTPVGM